LIGIYVYYFNSDSNPRDYVLGLLSLIGQHTGANITTIINATLKSFKISAYSLGYFVLNNATNNDAIINALAIKYNFNARY
ncbi:hypothetical protein BU23DRAFT_485424, partial [Bimuria novae-zelandiae CBS 107.79]